MAIIIGSRDSELAMIQTNHVKQSLEVKFPHLKFEVVSMKTIGDKNLEQPLKDVGKSLFTKELETLLLANQCDFVVHSLKDMPTSLPVGLVLGAILEREDPSDVIISKHGNIETLAPGSIVGTSSVRRIAQLKRVFPHLVYKDIVIPINSARKSKYQTAEIRGSILAILVYCTGQCGRCSNGLEKSNNSSLEHRTVSVCSWTRSDRNRVPTGR